MEFEAVVLGEKYVFSALNNQTFLVTGTGAEYILYNYGKNWKCADEMETHLLMGMGEVINERIHQTQS